MNKTLLVTLADKDYIDQAKQLFSSVYWNAGWKGDYMLLSRDIPESEIAWFTGKGIIVFRCDRSPLKSAGLPREQEIYLSKFNLFKTYFKKWDNIVYLDADIIVRHSLGDLIKLKGFNACSEPFDAHTLREQFYESALENTILNAVKEKYDLRKPAFNAGVFAFSTDVIQDDSFISTRSGGRCLLSIIFLLLFGRES